MVKKQIKIASIFPKYLFWDMDYEKMNYQRDMDIIIPRALYMTNKNSFDNDIKKLENIYTSSQIIKHLKTTKEFISNEICEMVALRYSIPTFYRFPKKQKTFGSCK